jgi:hypothetical protein
MGNHVYAVVYGNYDPPEVESLWSTKRGARTRERWLNDSSPASMWRVVKMKVDPGHSAEEVAYTEEPAGGG